MQHCRVDDAVSSICDALQHPSCQLSLPGLPPPPDTNRVLVVEAMNVTPHLETSLEIALRLAQSGYAVDYLHYGNQLPYVEFFFRDWFRLKELLSGTLAPQRKGLIVLHHIARRLGLPLRLLKRTPAHQGLIGSIFSDTILSSIDALKSFAPEGYPTLGLSVASSLISRCQDPYVRPSDHLTLCRRLVKTYLYSYSMVEQAIRDSRYCAVVVFNGRQVSAKAAVTAAKRFSIPVFYHERGSSAEFFSLRSFQPQDRLALQRDIIEHWRTAPHHGRHGQASRYFDDKRSGSDRIWVTFTAHQRPGLASVLLTSARRRSVTGSVITYFASSDDEVAAADDVYARESFEWQTQAEALNALAIACHDKGHFLLVRCHPHLSSKGPAIRRRWTELDFVDKRCRSNVQVVDSDSPISTYELIDGSDVVATYGSTVGIEAVYWSKPSLLLSNSFYDRLDAVNQVFNSASMKVLLSDFSLLDVSPLRALPYGYYMQTYGEAFRLFRPSGLFDGTFGGLKLQTYNHSSLFRLLERVMRIAQQFRRQ